MRTGSSALIGALAAERYRLTHARLVPVLLVVVPVIGFVATWLSVSAGLADGLGSTDTAALGLSTGFATVPYLAAVSGLAAVTGDATGPVGRSLFAWVPTRWPVVVAKALTQAVVAAVLAVGAGLAGLLGLWSGAGTWPPLGPDAASVLGGGLLAAVLLALLGVGVGAAAARTSQAYLALGALLIVVPIVAGTVSVASPAVAGIARVLPMAAANVLFDPLHPATGVGFTDASWTLAAWAMVALTLGVFSVSRRDVS